MGHGSEVAWALWMCVANNIPISDATANFVVKMKDNLVALLALHVQNRGLTKTKLDTSYWDSLMTTAELRTENWLLSYEASIKGWLKSQGAQDHIAQDPFFEDLRNHSVSFYDVTNLTIIRPASITPPGIGGAVRSVA